MYKMLYRKKVESHPIKIVLASQRNLFLIVLHLKSWCGVILVFSRSWTSESRCVYSFQWVLPGSAAAEANVDRARRDQRDSGGCHVTRPRPRERDIAACHVSPDPAIPGNSGHGARDAREDCYYSDKIVNSTWRARAAYCAVVQVRHFVIFSTHF